GRIGNAGEVLRASHRRRLRGKEGSQRIAGRGRESEPLHRQVEIEIVDPLAILHGIDNAHGRVDAQRPEILDERHVVGLERRLIEQEFDADRLALRRHRLPSLMTKPASCNSVFAWRRSARSCPEPSETGGTNGSPNTSSATLPRNGSSSANSSREG